MPATLMQPSFAAGELSPALAARVDLAKYPTGCRTLRNMLVHPHGGASNRPGMQFIREAKDEAHAVRLIPFQYSTEQAYILEFGNGYLRFYMDGGIILGAGGVPYEISSPFLGNEVWDVNYVQSADVLWLVHPNHAPMTLSRRGHADWSLAAFEAKNGPYADPNIGAISLGASALAGSVTLSASAALFTSGHVGASFRISHFVGAVRAKGVPGADTLQVTAYSAWRVESSGYWKGEWAIQQLDPDTGGWNTIRTFGGCMDKNYSVTDKVDEPVTLRIVTPSSFEQTLPTGGTEDQKGFVILEALPASYDGWVRITAVSSSTRATAQVMRQLGGTAATKDWAEGAWSGARGYPTAVGFYQDRLVFAATRSQPQTLWFSRVGDYGNFGVSTPLKDDDGITIGILARDVNEVRGIVPLRSIVVLTSDGEWEVTSSGDVLTPGTPVARVHGYRGSSLLPPLVIGDVVLFCQNKGSRVRDLGYSYESDGFQSKDMSILSEHLFREHNLADWAYQQEPWSIAWTVRSDGALLGLTYLKEHDVWAWHRHDTRGGAFESVACISGPGEDEAWFVVRRTVGGQQRRYIERMHRRLPGRDVRRGVFLDSALSYDEATPRTIFSGLEHLEGCTVGILADGNVCPDQVVSGGRITIPYPATVVHAGLRYEADLETLGVEIQAEGGTIQGRLKAIPSVTVRVEDTRGFWAGPDPEHLDELKMRAAEPMGSPVDLFTGDKEISLPGGYSPAGRLVVRQPDPLPLTVLAVIPKVVVGG